MLELKDGRKLLSYTSSRGVMKYKDDKDQIIHYVATRYKDIKEQIVYHKLYFPSNWHFKYRCDCIVLLNPVAVGGFDYYETGFALKFANTSTVVETEKLYTGQVPDFKNRYVILLPVFIKCLTSYGAKTALEEEYSEGLALQIKRTVK